MACEGQPHPDELKELERELRALVPRGPRVEMARMMYLAGQASMSPVPPVAPGVAPKMMGWFWPLSTGAMTLVALWLGALLVVLQTRPGLVNNAGHSDPPHHAPHPPVVVDVAPPLRVTQPTVAAAPPRAVAPVDGEDQTALSETSSSSPKPGTYGTLTRRLMNEQRRSTQRATMWSELFSQ